MGALSVLRSVRGKVMIDIEYLKRKYRYAQIKAKVNWKYIPVSNLGMDDNGMEEFNRIFEFAKGLGIERLVRTPSGGISIDRKKFRGCGIDVSVGGYYIELVIVYQGMWRFQFRTANVVKDDEGMYGYQAFGKFRKLCEKYGIDLARYEIENGKEIKQEIEKYMIDVSSPVLIDKELENCHHIDFHNSFPAGLANTHKEFRPVIEELYNGRKQHEEYKAILNLTIGYFQSLRGCQARWAHLSRDAIKDNNDRVRKLADMLKASGRRILLYNTDGIWYQGTVFHDEGEGSRLGEWENDHQDCKLRIKSKGAYEFIEDGKYYPVVRGSTRLDKIKPRDEWTWGDIYKCGDPLMYGFDWDKGIYVIE